jgi:putative transposase
MISFGEPICVVAMGLGIDGTKHPLSLVEGSPESTTLVRELLVWLRERGLDITPLDPGVIDGAKTLHRAVRNVFDHPVIQRCQLHELRNVQDRLNSTTPTPAWRPACLRAWPRL